MNSILKIIKSELFKQFKSIGIIIIGVLLSFLTVVIGLTYHSNYKAFPPSIYYNYAELETLDIDRELEYCKETVQALEQTSMEQTVDNQLNETITLLGELEVASSKLFASKSVEHLIEYIYVANSLMNNITAINNDLMSYILFSNDYLLYYGNPSDYIYYEIYISFDYLVYYGTDEAMDYYEFYEKCESKSFVASDFKANFWKVDLSTYYNENNTLGYFLEQSYNNLRLSGNTIDIDKATSGFIYLGLTQAEIDNIIDKITVYFGKLQELITEFNNTPKSEREQPFEIAYSTYYALGYYYNNAKTLCSLKNYSDVEFANLTGMAISKYALNAELNASTFVIDNQLNLFQTSSFQAPLSLISSLNGLFGYNYGLGQSSKSAVHMDYLNTVSALCMIIISAYMGILGVRSTAGEVSSGTVKLILLRPHKRYKLLIGKFLSLAIIAIGLVIAVSLLSTVIGLLLFGANSGFLMVFNSAVPFIANAFTFPFIDSLGSIVYVLFYLMSAFACGVLTKRQGGAYPLFFIGFYLVFTLGLVLPILMPAGAIALPSSHIPFTNFFSLSNTYLGMHLATSIIITLLYLSLFAFITLFFFTKRDY